MASSSNAADQKNGSVPHSLASSFNSVEEKKGSASQKRDAENITDSSQPSREGQDTENITEAEEEFQEGDTFTGFEGELPDNIPSGMQWAPWGAQGTYVLYWEDDSPAPPRKRQPKHHLGESQKMIAQILSKKRQRSAE